MLQMTRGLVVGDTKCRWFQPEEEDPNAVSSSERIKRRSHRAQPQSQLVWKNAELVHDECHASLGVVMTAGRLVEVIGNPDLRLNVLSCPDAHLNDCTSTWAMRSADAWHSRSFAASDDRTSRKLLLQHPTQTSRVALTPQKRLTQKTRV